MRGEKESVEIKTDGGKDERDKRVGKEGDEEGRRREK